MKAIKTRRPLSEAEGFDIISDYFNSGMSNVDYCRTHDISEWQFYKWKRLYLLEHPEQKLSNKKTAVRKRRLFSPVEVEDQPIPSSSSLVSLPAIEIEYPGGVCLRFSEGLKSVSIIERLLNR